ncbi:MAG: prepilin-type N-terminal cleavage/methylation domain-containing protein [Candidatus Omnitrophota bacterium]
MKRNQGVSLIEILVSCVIIALLVGGLGSIFVAGSRWITGIHSQSAAEEVGKLFLDPMQMHVRQSDWNTAGVNALALGISHCDTDGTAPQNPLCQGAVPIINNARRQVGKIDYNVEYNIQNSSLNNNVRRVRAIIRWQEQEVL